MFRAKLVEDVIFVANRCEVSTPREIIPACRLFILGNYFNWVLVTCCSVALILGTFD
jgi:hypothetical protein